MWLTRSVLWHWTEDEVGHWFKLLLIGQGWRFMKLDRRDVHERLDECCHGGCERLLSKVMLLILTGCWGSIYRWTVNVTTANNQPTTFPHRKWPLWQFNVCMVLLLQQEIDHCCCGPLLLCGLCYYRELVSVMWLCLVAGLIGWYQHLPYWVSCYADGSGACDWFTVS